MVCPTASEKLVFLTNIHLKMVAIPVVIIIQILPMRVYNILEDASLTALLTFRYLAFSPQTFAA